MKISTFLQDLKNNQAVMSLLGQLNLSIDELIAEAQRMEAKDAEKLGALLKPIAKDYGLYSVSADGEIDWKGNKKILAKREAFSHRFIAEGGKLYGIWANQYKIMDTDGNVERVGYIGNPSFYAYHITKSADTLYFASSTIITKISLQDFISQPKVDVTTMLEGGSVSGILFDDQFNKLLVLATTGLFVFEPDLSAAVKIASSGEELYGEDISADNLRWFDKTNREVLAKSGNRVIIFKLLDDGTNLTGIQITKMFDFGVVAFYSELGAFRTASIADIVVSDTAIYIGTNQGKIFKFDKGSFEVLGALGNLVIDKYAGLDDDMLLFNGDIYLATENGFVYLEDTSSHSLVKIAEDIFFKTATIEFEKPNFTVEDVIFADISWEDTWTVLAVTFNGADFVGFKQLPKIAAVGK